MTINYFRLFPNVVTNLSRTSRITTFNLYNRLDGFSIIPYANQVFDTVPYAGLLKRWNGTTWVKEPLKRWNGTSWVTANLKVYKAGSFQLVDTTGI